jgi:hypothetical protein
MESAVVVHGTYANNTFVPDKPMPELQGRAELIVYAECSTPAKVSIFDLMGKAPVLRSGEDIDTQLEEERNAWDAP